MDISRAPTSPDADVAIYLHAELLPNIRQITLYASLPPRSTFDGVRPEIELSESRKAVTVSLTEPYQHVVETIKLPARVSGAARGALKRCSTPLAASKSTENNHDFSFRMPIDIDGEGSTPRDELIDEYIPWTAADMSPTTRIRCRMCGTAFLNDSNRDYTPGEYNQTTLTGWVWKDLPSGNWAEMMDFWHCHKPDPHKDNSDSETTAALRIEETNAQVKGYGTSSRVEATPGSILIDVATFLLAEADCVGLRKGSENEAKLTTKTSEARTLTCESCNAIIGMEDPATNGWRLLKAIVSLSTAKSWESEEDKWESHPTEMIIAAQLLELIERESARRFVVHRGQKSGLLLWVFNPDLRYSNSSSGHSINAQQAMKVFFQETSDVNTLLDRDLGKPSPLSVEEVELPSMIFEVLENALRGSNQMLPLSARRFNEWQVGLLNRFNRKDLSRI
ncbi:hypothetical protein N7492_007699 [Penicillium capsulatum]|uniref:Ubiquitin-conjugating enzyme E2C-binding protein n=1 Tax=Penicillium capsulatum TaxID=69766 RepID=A0A9W9I0B8_9EURO|nr:hypothetical protein N7492_007699 [Penicillium capsulatum]KAJ6117532.1 hypothetical protein N7512_007257 [Penicillium capsulatum]